jgi:hypothetical protein
MSLEANWSHSEVEHRRNELFFFQFGFGFAGMEALDMSMTFANNCNIVSIYSARNKIGPIAF